MKKISILILLLACMPLTEGQEISPHQLGFNIGATTGTGIAYRYWPGRFGIQVTFYGMRADTAWKDQLSVRDFFETSFRIPRVDKYISIGFQLFSTIKQFDRDRLFLYAGNHVVLLRDKNTENIGFGMGYNFNRNPNLSLMFGYGMYDITGDLKLFPTAEVSLLFPLTQNKRQVNK